MPRWWNAYTLVLETSARNGLGVQISLSVPTMEDDAAGDADLKGFYETLCYL